MHVLFKMKQPPLSSISVIIHTIFKILKLKKNHLCIINRLMDITERFQPNEILTNITAFLFIGNFHWRAAARSLRLTNVLQASLIVGRL